MTTSELIEFLKKQPEVPVVYRCYSEQNTLEPQDIKLQQLCLPRDDGWVENARPDKPTRLYLVLPGN